MELIIVGFKRNLARNRNNLIFIHRLFCLTLKNSIDYSSQTKMQIERVQLRELDHKGVRRKPIRKHLCFGLIGSTIILVLIAYASTGRKKTMANCIFCDIVNGKLPNTKIEVETDEYVIFKDIKPASTYHYLCVTKKHIDSLKTMTKDDVPLVNRMEESLRNFLKSQDIDTNDALFGFHMPPFITVKHLHMHGIAPRSTMSWTNSIMFKPSSYWFKTVQEAIEYLNNKS